MDKDDMNVRCDICSLVQARPLDGDALDLPDGWSMLWMSYSSEYYGRQYALSVSRYEHARMTVCNECLGDSLRAELNERVNKREAECAERIHQMEQSMAAAKNAKCPHCKKRLRQKED